MKNTGTEKKLARSKNKKNKNKKKKKRERERESMSVQGQGEFFRGIDRSAFISSLLVTSDSPPNAGIEKPPLPKAGTEDEFPPAPPLAPNMVPYYTLLKPILQSRSPRQLHFRFSSVRHTPREHPERKPKREG